MIYAFEDFELDLARDQLRRGGVEVAIEATPLQLLVYLVRHRDRDVPQHELLDEIWPGVAVSESALSSAIEEVRRALADDERTQRVRRGRGFRFLPEVDVRPAATPLSRAPTRELRSSVGASARHVRAAEASGLARLAPADRWLLLLGLPLWLVCYGLALHSYVAGTAYPPLGVPVLPAGEHVYPELQVRAPIVSFEGSALAQGDRIVRVGAFDQRGASSLSFFIDFVEAALGKAMVEVEVERDGARLVTDSPVVPLRMVAPVAATTSPAFLLIGVLLILRRPRDPTTRALFQAAVPIAIALTALFGSPPWKTALSIVLQLTVMPIAGIAILRFLFVFPGGTVRCRVWHRCAFAAIGVAFLANPTMIVGFPLSMATGVQVFPPLHGVLLLGIAAMMWTKYRGAEPLERRQLKWFAFGTYAAILPPALAFLAFALFGGSMQPAVLSQISYVLIPLSIFVGVARANLFDVDRLISATLSANLLLFLAVATGLVLVPRLAEAASGVLGIQAEAGQLLFSALIAGGAIPLQGSLRPRLERWLFRERHAIDAGIARLLREVSNCREPAAVVRTAGDGLMELLRPETCALYTHEGDAYSALYAAGAAIPPAVTADTPLIDTLRRRRSPLALDERGGTRHENPLDPFDRAVLDTLGAHVVLPIVRGDELTLLLCLGPKESGDVYTPTDVALLDSLARTTALTLERFDPSLIDEETRKLQASMRRYVPGAIATAIAQGDDLDSSAREISVLFVDLRGYTALSEGHRAEQIFTTVNRYTEAVSRTVAEHGGAVVEFNGDGMMAVFGAPEVLPAKEEAAVAAARSIVEAVRALPGPGGERALHAGVGIATGEAFVGNIQAADRLIWSAIGNTTNLAARLEALTREIDADVVIDATTWERGGVHAVPFEPALRTPIRGRSAPMDLYVFRATAQAAA